MKDIKLGHLDQLEPTKTHKITRNTVMSVRKLPRISIWSSFTQEAVAGRVTHTRPEASAVHRDRERTMTWCIARVSSPVEDDMW